MKYNAAIKKKCSLEEKGRIPMKKLIAAILAISMTLLCCACGKKADDSDLSYIQKKGTLVLGITDYEPMDYQDENGNWTGFDAEFAQAVAEKLGVEAQFVEIDWDNKFFELESKAIDCIWNGMTITDEVKLNASVSNPYVKNAQVVVMNKLSAPDYDAIELLRTLTFAVEAGSAGEAELKAMDITDYTAVQSQSSALMEVAAGTANACVIDITMANAMTGEGTGYPDLTYTVSLTSEEYVVGFRKGSDLVEKFNQFWADACAEGTVLETAKTYGVQESVIIK